MAEEEFEGYLRLLGRFLNLRGEQLDRLSAEFRDHLETRLAELKGRGVPREEAVRIALDEFGDAASLAEHFRKMSRLRTRRRIVRVSTAAACVCGLILFVSWPDGRGPEPGEGRRAVADTEEPAREDDGFGGFGPVEKPEPAEEYRKIVSPYVISPAELTAADQDAIDRRLAEKIDVAFDKVPLLDALRTVADLGGFRIVVDPSAKTSRPTDLVTYLRDTSDRPISFSIADVKIAAVLELILQPYGVEAVNRDDYLWITEAGAGSDVITTEIYHLRDLVGDLGDTESATPEERTRLNDLVSRIAGTILTIHGDDVEPWWTPPTQVVGFYTAVAIAAGDGRGHVRTIGTVLVVRQNEAGHREVARMLEQLGMTESVRRGLLAYDGKQSLVLPASSGRMEVMGGGDELRRLDPSGSGGPPQIPPVSGFGGGGGGF